MQVYHTFSQDYYFRCFRCSVVCLVGRLLVVCQWAYRCITQNSSLKFFLLSDFFVSCFSMSIKRQHTNIHFTVNALNMGLIPYSVHSVARHKKAVTDD